MRKAISFVSRALPALLFASLALAQIPTVGTSPPAGVTYVATTAPATCAIGQTWFDSDAAAGVNLYGCTAANTWTLQSGAGGTATPGYGAASATGTMTITKTVGASITDYKVYSLTGNATYNAFSGYVAGDSVTIQTIQHASAAKTLAFGSGIYGGATVCTDLSSTTTQTFHYDGVAWLAGPAGFYGCTTGFQLAAGFKPMVNSTDAVVDVGATQTLAAKTLTAPTINGGATDLGAGTLEIPNSTTLPATCTVGQQYMDTDATSGQRHYLCESTNTWAVQGGGGGSSGTSTSPICIPYCFANGAGAGAAFTSKVGHYIQFEVPVAKTINSLSLFVWTAVGTCTTTCGFAASIYDATCTTKLGSITTSTALTSNSRFNLTMASPLALTPGTYILGFGTDGTALKLNGASTNLGLENANASLLRYFTATNALTGDNGTLAMPSACTTSQTVISAATAVEILDLLP